MGMGLASKVIKGSGTIIGSGTMIGSGTITRTANPRQNLFHAACSNVKEGIRLEDYRDRSWLGATRQPLDATLTVRI